MSVSKSTTTLNQTGIFQKVWAEQLFFFLYTMNPDDFGDALTFSLAAQVTLLVLDEKPPPLFNEIAMKLCTNCRVLHKMNCISLSNQVPPLSSHLGTISCSKKNRPLSK